MRSVGNFINHKHSIRCVVVDLAMLTACGRSKAFYRLHLAKMHEDLGTPDHCTGAGTKL